LARHEETDCQDGQHREYDDGHPCCGVHNCLQG
jgi:hypothetical protein